MKKVVGVLLAVILVFALTATTLAAEVEVLDPVDADKTNYYVTESEEEGAPIVATEDAGIDVEYGQMSKEDEAEFIKEELIPDVASAPDLVSKYDAVKQIGISEFIDTQTGEVYDRAGWIQFFASDINSYDKVKIYRDLLDGYFQIQDAVYDATDNSWWFYSEEIGVASLYFALIERGVDPVKAAEIAKQEAEASNTNTGKTTDNAPKADTTNASTAKSPKTGNNSMDMGTVLLLMSLAAAGAVAALMQVKKSKQTA